MSRIRDTSGKKRRNRVAGAAENCYFCKYNEHQYVEPSADLLDKLDEVYAMMKSTIRIMKGGKDVTDY